MVKVGRSSNILIIYKDIMPFEFEIKNAKLENNFSKIYFNSNFISWIPAFHSSDLKKMRIKFWQQVSKITNKLAIFSRVS